MSSLRLLALLGFTFGLAWSAVAPDNEAAGEQEDAAARSIILPGNQNTNPYNCQWQLQTNPCANNVLQALNFPHPSDAAKFVQCGLYQRPFIVQCPTGEVYDQATSTCLHQSAIVSKPVYNLASVGIANPCSAANFAAGNVFYAISSDNTRFIQCDVQGGALLLTCPANMVWNQNVQSCVFATQGGVVLQVGAVGTVGTGAGTPGIVTTSNPCTAQAASSKALYFAHPDPSKFIQCDLQGNAFVQQCPSGLLWDQSVETCATRAQVTSQMTSYMATNQVVPQAQYVFGTGLLCNTQYNGGNAIRG